MWCIEVGASGRVALSPQDAAGPWWRKRPPALLRHVVEDEWGAELCSEMSFAGRNFRIWDVDIWFWGFSSLMLISHLSLSILGSFFRYVLLLFILFFVPGVMMIISYGLISRELYRGIQFELDQSSESTGEIYHEFNPSANGFSYRWR